MATFYLISDYGKLHKNGDVLQFHYSDDTIATIFPHKTEQLVIIGRIELTGSAMKLLMHHKIDTVFLNKNGRMDGRLVFQEGKNVFLRQKQYKLLEDEKFKLAFCKQVISGKLHNQLTFMQRIKRERKPEKDINATIIKMKDNINNLEKAGTVDQARGYEGLGSRYYFSIFKYNILQDWAVFKGRSMNPPQDNVNAVLSFLYTLISYRVEGAIEQEGLDCYAGYLHNPDYGRKSLVFDLMEEYRTPVAETLAAALFNLGILEAADFEEIVFSRDNDEYPLEVGNDTTGTAIAETKKGVLLTKNGLKKVISQFEKKLDTTVYYILQEKSLAYKKIIGEQVKHFKRVINGEEATYKPLLIK